MSLENLNSNHYLETEIASVTTALTAIETALVDKFKYVSAEDRKKYGSINEQNKLIVNKIKDYKSSQPDLSSPDIDWEEFMADYKSRAFLEQTIARMQKLIDGLNGNKVLHDYDNYRAALADYSYSQYKAGANMPGYENKVNDIAQFFTRTNPVSKVVPN